MPSKEAKETLDWIARNMERTRKEHGDKEAEDTLQEMKHLQTRSYFLDQIHIIHKQRQIAFLQDDIDRLRRQHKTSEEVLEGLSWPVNNQIVDEFARMFWRSEEGQQLTDRAWSSDIDKAMDAFLKRIVEKEKEPAE